MQKLYCYVDETGQNTEGDLFVVSIVLTEKEKVWRKWKENREKGN